jgi:hypothetical protein
LSLSHESFLPDAFCLLKFQTAPDSAEPALRGEILKPVDLIGACLFGPASLASPEQCLGIAQESLNPACATFHQPDLRPLWPTAMLRGPAYDQFRRRDPGCDLRTSI